MKFVHLNLLLVIVLSYGLSLYFFCGSWEQTSQLPFFLIAHIFSVGCTYVLLVTKQAKGKKLLVLGPCLIALCIPLFSILFLLIVSTKSKIRSSKLLEDEVEEEILADSRQGSFVADSDHHREIMQEKINLQSFIDIIQSQGNEEEKIKMLTLLSSNHATPEIIEMIKMATLDSSSEVKIIAVSTLKKIENPILENVQTWKKILKNDEENTEAYINLGITCLNYCLLGIPDQTNTAYYLDIAESAYVKALTLEPERTDILIELVRTLIERKKFTAALEHINRFMFIHSDDRKAILYKAEILFQQKEFNKLTAFLKEIDKEKFADWHHLEEMQAFWS